MMKPDFSKVKNKLIAVIKSKAFIIIICLLLMDIILGLICRALTNRLFEQSEAERWSAEKKSAQVSLFFSEDQLIDTDFIRKMEYVMEGKMTDAGIVKDEEDEDEAADKPVIIDTQPLGEKAGDEEENSVLEQDDSRLFASCYSAQGLITIEYETKSADNVTTIGTSGDFFLFHPLELLSGSFPDKDAVMKDGIVIDEDLSWQLFGSSDVTGQMVTIGGTPHYISGVVKRQEGKLREAAGQNGGIAYISYDSLCKYGEILSGRTTSEEISEDGQTALKGGINCYEVVMPSPVDGIVQTIVKESAALDDKYISVINNTDRFSAFALFDVVTSFGTRSMWDKAIFYPYWENLARGYEDILSACFLVRMICRAVVICMIAVFVVNAYRHKTWTVSEIVQKLSDKKYDYEVKQKQRKSK